MEVREKKVLIYAISAVLVIAVLLNFYHGSTVTKIDIPGLFGIEFNSGNNTSERTASSTAKESGTGLDGSRPADQTMSSAEPERQWDEDPSQARHEEISPAITGFPAYSHEPQTRPEMQRVFNVTGYWYSDDGSSYEISQSGSRIEFIEYGLWGVTASGSGILSGNKLNIDYQTSFGTIGRAVLELSDDGQSMTGRADDLTTGASTIMALYKE